MSPEPAPNLVVLSEPMALLLGLGLRVDRQELAERIAQQAGLEPPSRPESVRILTQFTIDVVNWAFEWQAERDQAIKKGRNPDFDDPEGPRYYISLPMAGQNEWIKHFAAASDLGVLDTPIGGGGHGASETEPVGAHTVADLFEGMWMNALQKWADAIVEELVDRT